MSGQTLFVFVPALNRVQVVNTKKRTGCLLGHDAPTNECHEFPHWERGGQSPDSWRHGWSVFDARISETQYREFLFLLGGSLARVLCFSPPTGIKWFCLLNGKAVRDCNRYIWGCELRIRDGHARSTGERTGSTYPAAEFSSGLVQPFWVRFVL